MFERESTSEVLSHTGHFLDQWKQLAVNILLIFFTLITDTVHLKGEEIDTKV